MKNDNKYILLSSLNLDNDTSNIFNEIKVLTKKKNPRLLYIPAATNDDILHIIKFEKYFKKYGITVDLLLLTKEVMSTEDVKYKFDTTDIIFFGGGNTKILVEYVKKYNIHALLKKVTNKVICGLSAGAIMLSNCGLGDSESYMNNYYYRNFKMVEGIGILDFIICPHYQKEELIVFNDIIKNYNFNCLCIEDETGLFIDDNQLYMIRDNLANRAYYFFKKEFVMKYFVDCKKYRM